MAAQLYVYGVVPGGGLPRVTTEGVGGQAVSVAEHGTLAALVTPLSGQLRVKRRDLDRHLSVLQEAFATTTILPCAFGTVLSDEAEIAELLGGDREAALLDALARLDGMVQLNVKALYDETELLRELVEANPDIRRLRQAAGHHERLELGERVAAAVELRRDRDRTRLAAVLAQNAADLVEDEPGHLTALKASVLLPAKRVGRFERRLEELARNEAPVLRFDVIGPLPPTAFAGI